MATIQKTTNYNQFKFFKENRDVGRIENLLSSIKTRDMLAFHPIHVDKDFYVIDGQHRLHCAQELQIPIYYTQDLQGSLADIPPLNSNSRAWTSAEFTQFYAKQGKEEYIFIQKIIEKYKLEYFFVISCCCVRNLLNKEKSQSSITKLYKDGKIKLSKSPCDLEEEFFQFREILDWAKTNLNITRKNAVFNKVLMGLIRHPQYDHNRLLNKMNLNPSGVRICLVMNNSIDITEKLYTCIYNIKNSKSNWIYPI